MISDQEIISGCKEFEEPAQRALYVKYASKMKAICMRYARDIQEAEDMLHEGFIKIFTGFERYSGTGSLEGWIKRIMINTAIDAYKKRRKETLESMDEKSDYTAMEYQEESLSDLHFLEKDLMKALNNLPSGLRVVFNLFYMDNSSHREIAELLGIDEAASRTRLSRARKKLQNSLREMKQLEKTSSLIKVK